STALASTVVCTRAATSAATGVRSRTTLMPTVRGSSGMNTSTTSRRMFSSKRRAASVKIGVDASTVAPLPAQVGPVDVGACREGGLVADAAGGAQDEPVAAAVGQQRAPVRGLDRAVGALAACRRDEALRPEEPHQVVGRGGHVVGRRVAR